PRGRCSCRRLPARAAPAGEHPLRGDSLARKLVADPRLRLGSEPEASVERLVARTTCMSRPAKPARQSWYARSLQRPPAEDLTRFAAPALLAAAWRSRVPPDDSCSPFLSDPRRSLGSVEEFAAACEPAEVRLGVSESRLVGHAARDRGAGTPILLVKECEVSHVLRLLTVELGSDRF